MKPKRKEWLNKTATRTLDQFEVDLWDQSINANTAQTTYNFVCQLAGCDAFNVPGEDYCQVNPSCGNRYNNLIGTRRRRETGFSHEGKARSRDNLSSKQR